MLKKINLKLVGFIGVQRDEETRERSGREEKGKEKGGGKGKRRRERKKNQNFPPLFLAWRNNKIKADLRQIHSTFSLDKPMEGCCHFCCQF